MSAAGRALAATRLASPDRQRRAALRGARNRRRSRCAPSTSAADVGPAAVHYHFGSKQGLVEAVVRERAIAGAGSRPGALGAVCSRLAREPATARELVEAIAGPYLELLTSQPVGGLRWIKIVAQLALADAVLIGRVTAEIEPALFEQVTRAFPHVDPRILRDALGAHRPDPDPDAEPARPWHHETSRAERDTGATSSELVRVRRRRVERRASGYPPRKCPPRSATVRAMRPASG